MVVPPTPPTGATAPKRSGAPVRGAVPTPRIVALILTGKTGRLGFLVWLGAGVLVAVATGFFANVFDSAGVGGGGDALNLIGSIISILMIVTATWRRLHDLDRNGCLLVLLPVPFVNVLFLLYLLLKPGQVWQYTPEPGSPEPQSTEDEGYTYRTYKG